MKNTGNPKTKNEIEEFVMDEYFIKYKAIERRLDEQVAAGNLTEVDGKYELTAQGKFITKSFGTITDLYNMDVNFTRM